MTIDRAFHTADADACPLYDLKGNRFDPPANVAGWIVRYWPPGARGPGELLYADDGSPQQLPRQFEAWEFVQVVDQQAGRYRLDPVDAAGTVMDDVPSAVRVIQGRKAARNGGGDAGEMAAIVQAQIKAQSEQMQTLSQQCALMMKAAATLLQAADGAGLPERKPAPVPIAPAPIPATADDAGELAGVLAKAVDQVMPLISHAMHTRVLGLSAEQSFALMGKPTASTPQPALAAAPASVAAAAPSEPQRTASPFDFLAHLQAIETALTPDEAQLARRVIQQLAPEEIADWKASLEGLSVDQAVTLVRRELGKDLAA